MNKTYKEMLLNTIKQGCLFMLMREDGSTLTISYNRNSEYPYCIRFDSSKGLNWESTETFYEVCLCLFEWEKQYDDTWGVFEW